MPSLSPEPPGQAIAERRWLHVGVLISLAYVPPLLTARGQVAADTKQYLYTSPGALLKTATSLWDAHQYGGHVTDQTVGYLWPMGPWFWAADRLGSPDWIAQRLWVGTILVVAGLGVRQLGRELGLSHWGAFVAALAYQLSPFVLTYVNRTSALLLPFAGLGWMMVTTIRSVSRGGWRYPALTALIVGTVGGINAGAIAMVGIAPALWLVCEVALRRTSLRRGAAAAGRIAGLCVLASLWWIVALLVQSRFGADVLAYSETVQAVSATSSAAEVQRGLGYWLFYGGDVNGRWNSASTPYLQSPALIAAGFLMVVLAAYAMARVRWRPRVWLGSCWLVGTVLAVVAHDPGSPIARLSTWEGGRATWQLALRSSTRAVPLVVLAQALSLGAGAMVLIGHRPRWRRATLWLAPVLPIATFPAAWNGTLVDAQLRRPEAIPDSWVQAAAALDRGNAQTRVLELPGQEFGAFSWGTTTDHLLAGLSSRPQLARGLVPLGSPGLMDLLYALDGRIQDGTLAPASLAPIARLLGVGDVVVRGDQAFWKYRTAPPDRVDEMVAGAPGLGSATSFGVVAPRLSPTDQYSGASSRPIPDVTIRQVLDPLPLVRTRPTGAVVVVGDGNGLIDAASAGLIPTDRIIQYAPDTPRGSDRALVVVTDTDQPRARQWRGSRDTTGAAEGVGRPVVDVLDPADARLPVFPDPHEQADTQQIGGRVTASAYGQPTAYRPEDRPVLAVDGDPTTFWRVGDRNDAHGQSLTIEYDSPRASTFVVRQPPGERVITEIDVTTDSATNRVVLNEGSTTDVGQEITVGNEPTGRISIIIRATEPGDLVSYRGQNAVGLDLSVDGQPIRERVRLASETLNDALRRDIPLAIVMTRERVDLSDPVRRDTEPQLTRSFELETGATFELIGTARPSPARAVVAGDTLLIGNPSGAAVSEIRLMAASGPSRITDVTVSSGSTRRAVALGPDGIGRFEAIRGFTLVVTINTIDGPARIDRRFDEPTSAPVMLVSITTDAPVPAVARCRRDVLSIDGASVAVTIVAGRLSMCDGAPIRLAGGRHEISSTLPRNTGLDVDQVVLRTLERPSRAERVAEVRTIDNEPGRRRYAIAPTGNPVWLVVGEGWNRGWAATVGGRSLGQPVRVDGGSMGWLVAASGGEQVVSVTWAPQRLGRIALRASGLGAALMLVIVVWPRRRRVGFAPMAAPMASLAGAEATMAFRLTEGIVAGVLAGVMVAPVVIGVSVVLGWLSSARRWFGHLMAPALFALIGLFYMFRQIGGRPLPGFGWVQSFERAHNVALVAVIALVVHTIASEARDR